MPRRKKKQDQNHMHVSWVETCTSEMLETTSSSRPSWDAGDLKMSGCFASQLDRTPSTSWILPSCSPKKIPKVHMLSNVFQCFPWCFDVFFPLLFPAVVKNVFCQTMPLRRDQGRLGHTEAHEQFGGHVDLKTRLNLAVPKGSYQRHWWQNI